MMRDPGGCEVAFHGEYREIVPDERIVTTEVYEGVPEPEPGQEVVNTVTLEEVDGRTRWTLVIRVPEPRGPGRDHRLRDGGGPAGRAGPARGAGRLPPLSVGVMAARRASGGRPSPREPFAG